MRDYTEKNPVFSDTIRITDVSDPGNAQLLNAAPKQLLQNDLVLAARINMVLGDNSDDGNSPGFAEGLDAKNMIDAINKVFISGNEAKNKLVDNLVAMGIQASTEDTWGTLLDKILDMTDTSNDTVTAAVLLDGYTAHNADGEQITGTIPELAGVTVDATGTTQDSDYTYFEMPAGHYDEHSKVRSANSNLGSVYYLGTGTSFNVSSSFPDDFRKFTSANFIVTVPSTLNTRGRGGDRGGVCQYQYASASPTYSYNPNNGILTVGNLSANYYLGPDPGNGLTVQGDCSIDGIKAYLVTGKIQ